MLRLTTLLTLLAVAICPEQQFLPTAGLYEGRMAIDPASGRILLFKKLYAYVGDSVTIEGTACDPDNEDPNYPRQTLTMTHEPFGTVVPIDPNGHWQFTTRYTETGWQYEWFALSDGTAVRMGTVAIYTRVNKPPNIACGGLRQ